MAQKQPEFTDAIMLLKADHKKVKQLFSEFQDTEDEEEKFEIADEICTELKIHAQIEEEIFYPAFRGKIDDDMLDEAIVEHDGAKVLINDIVANGEEDDMLNAKVTVLCEEISHHVEEEEQAREGMFAQCRQTDVDLVELRDRMLARKQELLELAEEDGLPPAQLAAVTIATA
jgi:hemerythrin superfamily protein